MAFHYVSFYLKSFHYVLHMYFDMFIRHFCSIQGIIQGVTKDLISLKSSQRKYKTSCYDKKVTILFILRQKGDTKLTCKDTYP